MKNLETILQEVHDERTSRNVSCRCCRCRCRCWLARYCSPAFSIIFLDIDRGALKFSCRVKLRDDLSQAILLCALHCDVQYGLLNVHIRFQEAERLSPPHRRELLLLLLLLLLLPNNERSQAFLSDPYDMVLHSCSWGTRVRGFPIRLGFTGSDSSMYERLRNGERSGGYTAKRQSCLHPAALFAAAS